MADRPSPARWSGQPGPATRPRASLHAAGLSRSASLRLNQIPSAPGRGLAVHTRAVQGVALGLLLEGHLRIPSVLHDGGLAHLGTWPRVICGWGQGST